MLLGKKHLLLISVSVALVSGCGKKTHASTEPEESVAMICKMTIDSGWQRPIELADPTYAQPIGFANTPINGTTIEAMVTQATISVRADGNACVACHGGAGSLRPAWSAASLDRASFCALIPAFLQADKPAVLKGVFSQWYQSGCPN